MKKILVAVIFVIAFASVGVTAQTIFIPRPPVVYNESEPVEINYRWL